MAIVSLFVESSAHAKVASESEQLSKVTIAYNVGNPPLKFKNEQGEAAGILVDIWRLWSEKTGIEIQFKEALFVDTLEMVKKGEADIHAGLFYTQDRDTFLDYSIPIIDINYHIFHHASLFDINTLDDLTPYRIGVPKGYTHSYVTENLPGAAIEVFDNFPALYDSALDGFIMVFVSPVMNIEYHLRKKGVSNPFRYNPTKPVYSRIYLGAVQEGKRKLLDAVNQGMAQISAAERISIQRKWYKRTKGDTEKDTYIIACDSNYAPMTMLNARGQPAGLFVDIWKKWAEKEKVQVHFLFDTWEGSIQAVKEGLADFHSGFESDETWLLSSLPFYRLSAKVYSLRESKLRSLEDLTDKKIASIDPYYAQKLKESNLDLETVIVNDYRELLGSIARGAVNGFIEDELAIEDIMQRQGRQGEFTQVDGFSYHSSISAVVHKENYQLLERINRGLQAISVQEYRQLENKCVFH